MICKTQLLSMMFARLAELECTGESMTVDLRNRLEIELTLICKILDDDVPEEYLTRLEKFISI